MADGRLVQNFRARIGAQGPQAVLSWDAPLDTVGVLSIRVVRKRFGFSNDVTDGTEIFSGPPVQGVFADLGVLPCETYYYTVFSEHSIDGFLKAGSVQGQVTTLDRAFFPQKLFELLPEFLVLADKRIGEGGAGVRILTQVVDAVTGENFNLDEDGKTKKGALRRFLKVLGTPLDEAKYLIDCIKDQRDVDRTRVDFLPLFAHFLGFTFNQDLPARRQRDEIRRAVPVYKRKGTIPGIQAMVRSVANVDSTVKEWNENLLCSNDETKTSPGFTTDEAVNIGLPTEKLYYSPEWTEDDEVLYHFGFTVFLNVLEASFPADILDKLNRKLCEVTPVCRKGNFGFFFGKTLRDFFVEEVQSPLDGEDTVVTIAPPALWLFSAQDGGPDSFVDRTFNSGFVTAMN